MFHFPPLNPSAAPCSFYLLLLLQPRSCLEHIRLSLASEPLSTVFPTLGSSSLYLSPASSPLSKPQPRIMSSGGSSPDPLPSSQRTLTFLYHHTRSNLVRQLTTTPVCKLHQGGITLSCFLLVSPVLSKGLAFIKESWLSELNCLCVLPTVCSQWSKMDNP